MMKKLIMIFVILICVAGLGRAAPTTFITFDEFPVGTAVSNEYASQGVIFHPGDVVPGLPIIDWNMSMPTQPILRPQGEAGGLPIYQGDFWIQFTTPVIEVQFDSGYWDGIGTGVINVYDPAMIPLASLTNTIIGVNVTNLSGMGQIGYIYFNSIGDFLGADIDNLGFTTIPAPGAILLGGIGAGLVGWLRRRRTL
ncbi:MAG: hypothetical protein ACYSUX_11030 [Planctomycetota bacterium]|jgi:hypothetical protein